MLLCGHEAYCEWCIHCLWAEEKRLRSPKAELAVALCVLRSDGAVILGKRKGTDYECGAYGFPGGKVTHGESLISAASRELREEAGQELSINGVYHKSLWCVCEHLYRKSGTHLVCFVFLAQCLFGEPRNAEPDKCEQWEWHSWDKLPANLMWQIRAMVNCGLDPRRPEFALISGF